MTGFGAARPLARTALPWVTWIKRAIHGDTATSWWRPLMMLSTRETATQLDALRRGSWHVFGCPISSGFFRARPLASSGAHESFPTPDFLMPIAQTRSAVVGTRQPQLVAALRPQLAPGQRFTLVPVLAALSVAFAALEASAASFNITSATPTKASQTLGTGERGDVAAAAALQVSGSSVSVTLIGNNASIVTLGTMKQTGTDRLIRDNTGVTGLIVTNGTHTDILPVPLPPSLALFLAGVGCVGLLFRRRRPG